MMKMRIQKPKKTIQFLHLKKIHTTCLSNYSPRFKTRSEKIENANHFLDSSKREEENLKMEAERVIIERNEMKEEEEEDEEEIKPLTNLKSKTYHTPVMGNRVVSLFSGFNRNKDEPRLFVDATFGDG